MLKKLRLNSADNLIADDANNRGIICNNQTSKSKEHKAIKMKKTLSRFLAIQAAYSMLFVQYESKNSVLLFIREAMKVMALANKPDYEFADQLCLNVFDSICLDTNKSSQEFEMLDLDKIISSHLNSNWSIDRVDLLILSVLRVAIIESRFFSTPHIVIISEYTTASSYLFEDSSSINFINAILQNILV